MVKVSEKERRNTHDAVMRSGSRERERMPGALAGSMGAVQRTKLISALFERHCYVERQISYVTGFEKTKSHRQHL